MGNEFYEGGFAGAFTVDGVDNPRGARGGWGVKDGSKDDCPEEGDVVI